MSDQPFPAATSPEEAAAQSAQLRARLDEDLAALESRLPDPETLQARAKMIGGAVGAGAALIGAGALVVKQRLAKRAERAEAKRHAEALVEALPQAIIDVRGEQAAAEGGSGRAMGLIGLALGLAALAGALLARRRGRDETSDDGDAPEDDVFGPPEDV